MILNHLNNSDLIKKTKIFFQSTKWKNILVFFTFVVLAFVFWLVKYYQQKFEVELSIPVHYKNTPPGIVLSASLPEKINLKLQDKGTVLLNYFFSRHWGFIDVNLEDISLEKSPYVVSDIVLASKINEHLLPTTQLSSFYPENIRIDYFPLAKKELPVVISGKIQAASGYILIDSVSINPPSVIAYGSPQSLDTLKEIQTAPVKKPIIEKKMNITLELKTPWGVRLSTDKVKLTADIEAFTEKNFELPIVAYNLPNNQYVRFFPSTVELVCQVALSKYSQLTQDDLEISVNYNDLKRNKNTTVSLRLSKKPKGVINYRIVPERVEYLIEQKRNS